jgi:hypothetical protein
MTNLPNHRPPYVSEVMEEIKAEYSDALEALGDEFVPEPPRGDLRWVALDLDGTLAEGIWRADNPTSDIGPIRPGVKAKCDKLVAAGYKPVIWTSRSYTDYENIEKWCAHNDLPIKHIFCGKLLAAVYIDDRALNDSESSWLPERAKELHEYGSHSSLLRQESEAFPQRIMFGSSEAAVMDLEGRVWDKRTNGQPNYSDKVVRELLDEDPAWPEEDHDVWGPLDLGPQHMVRPEGMGLGSECIKCGADTQLERIQATHCTGKPERLEIGKTYRFESYVLPLWKDVFPVFDALVIEGPSESGLYFLAVTGGFKEMEDGRLRSVWLTDFKTVTLL